MGSASQSSPALSMTIVELQVDEGHGMRRSRSVARISGACDSNRRAPSEDRWHNRLHAAKASARTCSLRREETSLRHETRVPRRRDFVANRHIPIRGRGPGARYPERSRALSPYPCGSAVIPAHHLSLCPAWPCTGACAAGCSPSSPSRSWLRVRHVRCAADAEATGGFARRTRGPRRPTTRGVGRAADRR